MGTEATITVSNFDIGPCQVYWDGDDLGGTLGNVSIKFKYDKADLKADQTGVTILDQAVSGVDVTIETMFAEVRNKVQLQKLFPNSDIGGTSPHQFIDFNNKVASRMLASYAKNLQLHPLVEDVAGKDFDWMFWKAAPTEESEYLFSATEQAKMKLVWRVYLDLSQSPARMFRMGDSTL